MSIEDMIAREVADTYTTPEQRAAYRAGLSSAAMLCDQRAAQVRTANPGRRKGTASSVGEFGAGIAKACGDDISNVRDTISVDRTPTEVANACKMEIVRKVLG